MRRALVRSSLAVFGAVAVSGCYAHRPLYDVNPLPGQVVVVELTDAGRAAMGTRVGEGTLSIEGKLVAWSDTLFTLSVTKVKDIRGGGARWNGESVRIERQHVRGITEKQFSGPRTIVALAGTTAAFAALVATQSLLGGGSGERPGRLPTGGDGSEQ